MPICNLFDIDHIDSLFDSQYDIDLRFNYHWFDIDHIDYMLSDWCDIDHIL